MAKSVADGNEEIQGGYASNDGLSMHFATSPPAKELAMVNQYL